MKRKWLQMAASALALAVAVLAGCGPQSGFQAEYPIVQPTRTAHPDGAATAAPMQQAAPAGTTTLESAQTLEAPATATEATSSFSPGAPAGTADTRQASNEVVEKAKADLAKKLGIPANEITLVLVIGQEFTPDGFYCRTIKGKISKEEPTVVISGEAILLKAQARRYEYHADGQAVTFCRQLP
jgi:hypothetical protein